MANDASPVHVDMMRFVKTSKGFVGKEAVLERAKRGESSKIALLVLEGEETDCLIGEAVFLGQRLVGSVTSAAYGYTVGKSLVIAFLKEEAQAAGTRVQISLLGEMVRATVLDKAPWDPSNERLRM